MGAAGWASTLQLSDFTEESGRDLGDGMPQDFVAIDRFTGGGKDGAKFQFRAFHQPILSGRLTLDTDRLAKIGHAKDSIGLLKLALRDLEEGDLRFGMGAAKGYGQVREAGFSPIEGWSAIMTAVVGNSPQSEAPKFQPETPKEFKEPPKPTQEAGSNEFLNPYQFVPPPTRLPGGNAPPPEGWKNLSDAKAAKLGHAGHQCFVNQAGGEPVYSGRIICQLTAETPLFVGGLREPYQPAKDGQPERLAIAHHFKLGNQRSNGSDAEPDGDLAIPASSLRGLISSLVEAATGSAMRVLDDRMLSYRKSADEALSAIGMVVKARNPKTGEEVWCIRPMTMQTKQWLPKDKKWIDKPAGDYPSFDGSPARLKAYVDRDVHDAVLTGSYWYASFDPLLKWTGDGYSRPGAIRHPSKDTHGNVHIGQKANGDGTLGFKDLRQSALTKDTRCLFRTMRHPERLKSMVKEQKSGKAPAFAKHDLLLPWPEEGNKLPLLPIPPHVIERFNQLADERTELSLRQQGEKATDLTVLPYHPVGTKRNNDKTLGTKLRLKPGDLVYFHSMKDGGALKVDEISFSAIWRDRVEEKFEEDGKTVKKAATVRRFFEKVSAELLPFNKKRQFLSPAEMMFGYASDDKKERPEEEWGGAYAGRVFPGHGLTKNAVQGDEVPLKILDAPKPPSPSLYFRPAQGSGYIAKKGLNPNDHRPNGRKFYLHQTQKLGNWKASEQYAQEHKKQVVRIRPVKEGAEFVFHLDFENLSAWELGALCYALRPEEAFRHKLGMGKPLGLGTVCIDPLGVFLVDRPRRYTKASETGRRYHYTWLAKGAGAKLEEWQERYPREAQTSELPGSPTFDQLREKFRSGMEPNLRKALLVLGDPAYVGDTPVRYPVAQGQQDDSEQFQWFVNNDKAGHYWDRLPDGVLKGQFLEPPISGLNRLKPNKDFALKSKAKDKK
jgi:CRISPR/Cas system CSM-associated protein Csm3 (group 7 of RAMP superfamily)